MCGALLRVHAAITLHCRQASATNETGRSRMLFDTTLRMKEVVAGWRLTLTVVVLDASVNGACLRAPSSRVYAATTLHCCQASATNERGRSRMLPLCRRSVYDHDGVIRNYVVLLAWILMCWSSFWCCFLVTLRVGASPDADTSHEKPLGNIFLAGN